MGPRWTAIPHGLSMTRIRPVAIEDAGEDVVGAHAGLYSGLAAGRGGTLSEDIQDKPKAGLFRRLFGWSEPAPAPAVEESAPQAAPEEAAPLAPEPVEILARRRRTRRPKPSRKRAPLPRAAFWVACSPARLRTSRPKPRSPRPLRSRRGALWVGCWGAARRSPPRPRPRPPSGRGCRGSPSACRVRPRRSGAASSIFSPSESSTRPRSTISKTFCCRPTSASARRPASAKPSARGATKKGIDPDEVKRLLAEEVERTLTPVARPLVIDAARKPFVILVVGVNGLGQDDDHRQAGGQIRRRGPQGDAGRWRHVPRRRHRATEDLGGPRERRDFRQRTGRRRRQPRLRRADARAERWDRRSADGTPPGGCKTASS